MLYVSSVVLDMNNGVENDEETCRNLAADFPDWK